MPFHSAVTHRLLLVTCLSAFLGATVLTQYAHLPVSAVQAQIPVQPPHPLVSDRPTVSAGLGIITGRVTLDGGAPAAGFTVRAFPAYRPFFRYNTNNPNTAITDANGHYRIDLQPMRVRFLNGPVIFNAKGYTVFVTNEGKPYVEPPVENADPDASTQHVVKDVNFILHLGPLVLIRACDALSGDPDPGIPITLRSDTSFIPQITTTGADGTVRLRLPLTHFQLNADLPPTLQAAPGHLSGGQFTAAPGQLVVWNIKTYKTQFHVTSTTQMKNGWIIDTAWHGIVLGGDGKPAVGALVRIDRVLYPESTTRTDAQGRFTIPQAHFDLEESDGDNRPGVFAEQGESRAWLTPTPDETWDGMTLHLVSGQQASITGQAVAPNGRRLRSVPVIYDRIPRTGGWGNGGVTGIDGRFTISHLVPGARYLLRLGGSDQFHGGEQFAETIVPNQPNRRTEGAFTGGMLTLQPGEHRDLGQLIVYPADKVIAGQLVTPKGQPLTIPVRMFLRGDHLQDYPDVDTSGQFRDTHVADEPLTLSVFRMHDGGCDSNPGSPDLLVQVPVHAGQENIRLVIGTPALPAMKPAVNQLSNSPPK